MTRRGLIIFAIVATGLGGAVYAGRSAWLSQSALAQQQRPAGGQGQGAGQGGGAGAGQARVVPVEVAPAVRRPVPLRVDALGTVVPLASVAIKSRLETLILEVHFKDGADVKEGDLLFTLDSRSVEAQIRQVEAMLARNKAQMEGAERDVRRFTELVGKNATPVTNLDNAKTQAEIHKAAIKADEAQLDNLRVQLSYCTIRAPINGRIGAASVKVGNLVRPGDTSALAVINQIAPIYVTFSVPQRMLPDLRSAMNSPSSKVETFPPGEREPVVGKLAMLDNAVDAATGMVTARAVMENSDRVLWPGALVNTHLTVRVEDVVSVPSAAIQIGQNGTYVFVVKDGRAEVRQVVVARTVEMHSVVSSGLEHGEVVVTDGHLSLANGTRVQPREAKAGS